MGINQWLKNSINIKNEVDKIIKSKEFEKISGKNRDHLRVITKSIEKIIDTKCRDVCKSYILIGPPGAGKGQVAHILQELTNKPHISTGSLLRDCKNKEIQNLLAQGKFADDKTMLTILQERLSEDDANLGIILDGYPRNVEQVEYLKDLLFDNYEIVYVKAEDKDIIDRLSNRRICSKCGETYNLLSLPPKKDGICDKCDSQLTLRTDDKPEIIKQRLETYHKITEPVLDKLSKKVIHKVNGFDTLNSIKNIIKEII